MPPDDSPISIEDRIRIERIVESVRLLESFTAGLTEESFRADEKTRRAIQQILIEVGEGVSRITPETRNRLPDIPWAVIVRMRNVLIHVYWGVDLGKIWLAATIHAPELARKMKTLLPPEHQS
jgi:uncharacterized protein with HEPN domain